MTWKQGSNVDLDFVKAPAVRLATLHRMANPNGNQTEDDLPESFRISTTQHVFRRGS